VIPMERDRDMLTTDDIAGRERDADAGTTPGGTPGEQRSLDEAVAPEEARAAPGGPATGRPATGADAGDGRSGPDTNGGAAPLLADESAGEFRTRWESIQTGFVDEPRRAVQDADALVAELMRNLADSFSAERKDLEGQWDRGGDVSTEDLRVALRRYRSFFDRLLAAGRPPQRPALRSRTR